MSTIIRTYRDWGPYFSSERFDYQVDNITDFITQIRILFEDDIPECIGIYRNDLFIGGWTQEVDGEPDYENGGYHFIHCGYTRVRPNTWDWRIVEKYTCPSK